MFQPIGENHHTIYSQTPKWCSYTIANGIGAYVGKKCFLKKVHGACTLVGIIDLKLW